MFFVDQPDALERVQIWDIVIARHGCKSSDFDSVALARACEQFPGAEIEAVFIDAMHEGFPPPIPNRTRRHLAQQTPQPTRQDSNQAFKISVGGGGLWMRLRCPLPVIVCREVAEAGDK